MEIYMTETNNTFDTETLDLGEIFDVLLQRIWTIILSALIVGSLTFGYTYFFVTPQYQSSALLYVNNSEFSVGNSAISISSGDLTTSQKLISTYTVILKSRTVLNEVVEKSGVAYSADQLSGMISAGSVQSTAVLQVIVTCPNPADAERIANTIAEVLPERIPEIINGSDVRVVDYAIVPSSRSSPSYTRNTGIGFLVGAVAAIVWVILAYLYDDKIRSEDYLSQVYPDIPLLAVIPNMRSSGQRGDRYGYRYGSKYGRYGRYGYRRSYYSQNSYYIDASKKRAEKPLTENADKGAAK